MTRLRLRPGLSFPGSVSASSLSRTQPRTTLWGRPAPSRPFLTSAVKRFVTGSSSSGSSSSSSSGSTTKNAQSLSERLRALFRNYGWAALAVYIGVSAIDFGLTFVAIYAVGADHVRNAEDWVLDRLHWRRKRADENGHAKPDEGKHDGQQTQQTSAASAMWTTAALAYTIHKTLLLPVRIGFTAWVTPPLVR
jgi:hypothetical protein